MQPLLVVTFMCCISFKMAISTDSATLQKDNATVVKGTSKT